MKSAREVAENPSTQEFAATFSGEEIAAILKPEKVVGTISGGSGSVSTDTRSLKKGQWYLALKGENFDGHQFVEMAASRGAAGCIVSTIKDEWKIPDGVVLIAVADTLHAYHAIGRHWLNQVKPFVIAVTGSSGKTTTKEMCAAVVSSMPSHKSRANENNEFGLPKTLLSMPPGTKILVAEMAMRGLRQIAQLAETAKPDAGIITGVGTAHIELLGSTENIIRAKCELFEEMKDEGLAIVGNPVDELVAHAKSVFKGELALFQSNKLQETEVTIEKTRFRIDGFSPKFELYAHGIRHIQDAWCAIVAARAAGLSDQSIADGLRKWRSVEGRGNRLTMPNGAALVDESYNANPDSVKCAIEAVLDQRAFPQEKKHIVLGEMAELGDNTEFLHQQTGEWIKGMEFTTLITVGVKASVIAKSARGGQFEVLECETQEQALHELQNRVIDKSSCVMIKGSHCANLDKLVGDLMSG